MGKKIFYSGDTGYCGVFKELGEVFGGFDLSILPIGAYHPRDFLKPQHLDPI
jgi:N-acyl-phosphatidylethanolamine-hydrolysing phospholipase D